MKMKRFFAASMQLALKDIRDELGADAVILSSKKTDGGVEVICALNYDEAVAREQMPLQQRASATSSSIAKETAARHTQLENEMVRVRSRIEAIRQQTPVTESAVQANPEPVRQAAPETGHMIAEMREEILQLRNMIQGQNPFQQTLMGGIHSPQPESNTGVQSSVQTGVQAKVQNREIVQRLQTMGVFPELHDVLMAKLDQSKGVEEQWRSLLARLAHGLRTEEQEIMDQEGNIVLVGPTGAGKTTTIAKIAARFVQKYGNSKLALVTTDRFRVAGTQQLQSFGRLLNVPVIVVDERRRLDEVLDELADKRLILIDTAGLNPHDPNWEVQRQDLKVERHELRNYLVLSAVNQPQVMKSTYHYYKMLGLTGCMMTKIDEAISLGEVMSMAIVNRLPVTYYTDGQQIPKDLHHARSHALVVRAVSLLQQASDWEKQTKSSLEAMQNLVV